MILFTQVLARETARTVIRDALYQPARVQYFKNEPSRTRPSLGTER